MLPIVGLLIFLKQYIVKALAGPNSIPWDETADSDIEDDEDEDKEKVRRSLKGTRLRCLFIGRKEKSKRASSGDSRGNTRRPKCDRTYSISFGSCKKVRISSANNRNFVSVRIFSTFNFTVPYLSWIAITLLLAGTIVLYLIPIRYLLMLWGTNKFFRRILRPHSVPNNEVLDLLSRVPDDEMLVSGHQNRKGSVMSLISVTSASWAFSYPKCIVTCLITVCRVVLGNTITNNFQNLLTHCWGRYITSVGLRFETSTNSKQINLVQMCLKLLATALSTPWGQLTVFEWYLQLDYKDLKILMCAETDRRLDPKKKHKAS